MNVKARFLLTVTGWNWVFTYVYTISYIIYYIVWYCSTSNKSYSNLKWLNTTLPIVNSINFIGRHDRNVFITLYDLWYSYYPGRQIMELFKYCFTQINLLKSILLIIKYWNSYNWITGRHSASVNIYVEKILSSTLILEPQLICCTIIHYTCNCYFVYYNIDDKLFHFQSNKLLSNVFTYIYLNVNCKTFFSR